MKRNKHILLWVLILFSSMLYPVESECIYGSCSTGFGIQSIDNGTVYVGQFSNGKFDGHGQILSAQGNKIFEGAYRKGEQVSDEDEEDKWRATIKTNYLKYFEIWKSDSGVISTIISPAFRYTPNYEDTDLVAKDKKDKLETILSQLNKKWKGKDFSLQVAEVKEVKEKTEFSKIGLRKAKHFMKGLKNTDKGKALLLMGNDPTSNYALAFYLSFYMGNCKDCFRRTGRYTIKFKIPAIIFSSESISYREDEEINNRDIDNSKYYEGYGSYMKSKEAEYETLAVQIFMLVTKKDYALSLRNGQKMAIKGKIQYFKFKNGQLDLYIK